MSLIIKDFVRQGGFGQVYKATLGSQELAYKKFAPAVALAPDMLKRMRARFVREVRVQSRLKHSNIMPVVSSDLTGDPVWFTMPFADSSFEERLESLRNLQDFPNDVELAVWQDVLAGVEELHRLGYVHRDLRPANILLVDGQWVVADFGLVLPAGGGTSVLSSGNSAYGSHYYAAPEQANDFHNVTEQADIFALGCILQDAVERTPNRIPFSPIRTSGPYSAVIGKCTASDPRDRYQTIAELRAAIFEVHQAQTGQTLGQAQVDAFQAVIDAPRSSDAWRTFIQRLETEPPWERHLALKGVGSDLIVILRELDPVLFNRLMSMVCEWASSTGFDWDYCDVVGDRLVEAFKLSTVRVQLQIVMAGSELAVSHNRWHVMSQVGSMLSSTTNSGLIDRLLIEMESEPSIVDQLLRIEQVVYWRREHWHPQLAAYLTALEQPAEAGEDA